MLTATQEDYIEAIHRIWLEHEKVTVTGLAERLGCKLPTVTRTIQKMVDLGYVDHELRGDISLTRRGAELACHLVHRHDDLCKFLVEILGLSREEAEKDVCQIEHGMSALSAQRLHLWLLHFEQLALETKRHVVGFDGRMVTATPDFNTLQRGRHRGWRE